MYLEFTLLSFENCESTDRKSGKREGWRMPAAKLAVRQSIRVAATHDTMRHDSLHKVVRPLDAATAELVTKECHPDLLQHLTNNRYIGVPGGSSSYHAVLGHYPKGWPYSGRII